MSNTNPSLTTSSQNHECESGEGVGRRAKVKGSARAAVGVTINTDQTFVNFFMDEVEVVAPDEEEREETAVAEVTGQRQRQGRFNN